MKKSILAASIALTLGASSSANAAFTALSDGDYWITVTSGCFAFGNCQDGMGGFSTGAFTGNTATQSVFTTDGTTALHGTSRLAGSTIGSGITTGADHGQIGFTLTGGVASVTSFRQNSYLVTAGGTFYLDAGTGPIGGMELAVTGDAVTFRPVGREGMAAAFATGIGVQAWNDSKKIGMFDAFSTGTTTNSAKGPSPAFSVSGTALTDSGVDEWTGVIAATGNINGAKWTGFNNVQYSEVFVITITKHAAIPVPAAAWLFGSGLLGLVGVARRRKSS